MPTFRDALAFLDTETTGLSPARGHRVIDLSILVTTPWPGLEVLGEYHTKIRPTHLDLVVAEAKALEINGYAAHPEAWAAAPVASAELWAKARDLLDGTVLVCQNFPFDSGFIEAEMRRFHLLGPDKVPWQRRFVEGYSFGHVAAQVHDVRDGRGYKTWSLAPVYTALGGPPLAAHAAKPDVLRLLYLYRHFTERYEAGCRALDAPPSPARAAG